MDDAAAVDAVKSKRTCLLVLGMHRSGTSALTRVLSIMGAALPKMLMGINKGNDTGHWEPQALVNYHDKMLAELGSNWDDWRPLELGSLPVKRRDDIKTEILGLIAAEYGDAPLTVIKDPRICRFTTLYLDAFASAGIDGCCVLMLRNPLEVVESLESRDGMRRGKAALLWLRHTLDAERATRNRRRFIVSYDSLLEDWRAATNRLSVHLRLNLDCESDECAARIDRYLTPTHRHHVRTSNDVLQQPLLQSWIADCYRSMLALKNRATERPAFATLDRIRSEFDGAAPTIWALEEESGHVEQRLAARSTALQVEHVRTLQDREGAHVKALAELSAERHRLTEQLAEQTEATDRLGQRQTELIANEQLRSERLQAQLEVRISQVERLAIDLEKLEDSKNVELRYKTWVIEQRDRELADVGILRGIGRRISAPVSGLARLAHSTTRKIPTLAAATDLLGAILRNAGRGRELLTLRRLRLAAPLLMRDPSAFAETCRQHTLRIRSASATSAGELMPPVVARLGSGAPLISVLIVNFNGRVHLPAVLASLKAQTYSNIQTIIADNASTDGSVEYLRQNHPEISTVALQRNLGFAEANNIAMEEALGNYIFLLNNDTRIAPDGLEKLLACIAGNPCIGAVAPKLRFWTKFAPLDIILPAGLTVALDIDALIASVPDYPKLFFPSGFTEPVQFDGVQTRTMSGAARLWLPIGAGNTAFRLRMQARGAGGGAALKLGAHRASADLPIGAWTTIELPVDAGLDQAQWLINNAGSFVDSDGSVGDLGFGQPDDGSFDQARTVTALCGCSMLIRRDALDTDGAVFGGRFFAYFEDTDLSLRLRRKGLTLAYCPDSIVYHRHASSSTENSPLFRFYVNRNRQLFQALNFQPEVWRPKLERARAELAHLQNYYRTTDCSDADQLFADRIDDIIADWNRLIPLIESGQFFRRNRYSPRIAVYNSFWKSLGGGEYHAAVIAEALQSLGAVELVSENDFSIEAVSQQFGLNLDRCRKVLITPQKLHHDPRSTSKYGIFVNSTFGSNLVSSAAASFYVVSFPFDGRTRRAADLEFLKSYRHFLANSAFTRRWCKTFWGVEATTLYPSVPNLQSFGEVASLKQKVILHVGRFFWHGHNKKQLELVQVFKSLQVSGRLAPDWTLVLAGQVEGGHDDYFQAVRDAAGDAPVQLHPNITRHDLTKLYERAAIYWHATGLNEDLELHPDRAEHFGITTLEAMQQGCVPIVIDGGGQPEIVIDTVSGHLFGDIETLKRRTLDVAELLNSHSEKYRALSDQARKQAANFSKSRTQDALLALLDAGAERGSTESRDARMIANVS